MQQDYSNLKEKTFLDFTDDEKLIREVIGDTDPALFGNAVSEYGRYITFLVFAERIHNKRLEKEVLKQLQGTENE
jgi:hypothetical protein